MPDEKQEFVAVTDEELAIAYVGPAPFANKFYVTVGPVVRIAFAEQGSAMLPVFRTAISLSHSDAIMLHRLLSQSLAPFEEKLAEAQAQAKSDAEE